MRAPSGCASPSTTTGSGFPREPLRRGRSPRGRPSWGVRCARAGARAVVFKRFAVETLMDALRAVTAGDVWLPPALQRELTAPMSEPATKALTPREREIVRLVALGFHNPEIAEQLSIGEVTVKTHINNVFHKLKIRDRVGLTLYALRLGLIGIHEKVH